MTLQNGRASLAARSVMAPAALGLLAYAQPAVAQPLPEISPAWIEQLCPAIGTAGFVLGKTEQSQPEYALAMLGVPGDGLFPFTGGKGVYTPWSGRLAGISWESALEYGEQMEEWRDAVRAALADGDWERREDTEFGGVAGWTSESYEKQYHVGGAERRMIFRFDSFDKYAADCGDLELLATYKREERGELDPGSERPVDPGLFNDPDVYLARFDCGNAALIEAFAEAGSPDVAGSLAESLLDGAHPYDAQAKHEERLRQWLYWTMLRSGKVDEDRLIEVWMEADNAVPRDFSGELEALMVGLDDVFKSLEAKDGARTCMAYRGVIEREIETSRNEMARDARINAAFEAEAQRLGIVLK